MSQRSGRFWKALARMSGDIDAVMDRDPAARSRLEVALTYSGFHAVQLHRVAHWLHHHNHQLFGRIVSQFTRWMTEVEIHPAALIGDRLFIDHGAGVVIGETAEVGNDVTILQGVTLGGTGKQTGKRHPTIKDRVYIGAGAKLLGGFTVGEGARVGANAVILTEVPANSTVVGAPGRVVVQDGKRTTNNPTDLLWMDAPLPEEMEVERLSDRLKRLEKRLSDLERERQTATSHNGGTPAAHPKPASERVDGDRAL